MSSGVAEAHISSPPHSASAARMAAPTAFIDIGNAWIFTGMIALILQW